MVSFIPHPGHICSVSPSMKTSWRKSLVLGFSDKPSCMSSVGHCPHRRVEEGVYRRPCLGEKCPRHGGHQGEPSFWGRKGLEAVRRRRKGKASICHTVFGGRAVGLLHALEEGACNLLRPTRHTSSVRVAARTEKSWSSFLLWGRGSQPKSNVFNGV